MRWLLISMANIKILTSLFYSFSVSPRPSVSIKIRLIVFPSLVWCGIALFQIQRPCVQAVVSLPTTKQPGCPIKLLMMNDLPLRYFPAIAITDIGPLTPFRNCLASSVTTNSSEHSWVRRLTVIVFGVESDELYWLALGAWWYHEFRLLVNWL